MRYTGVPRRSARYSHSCRRSRLNALKLAGKKIENTSIVINGAGSAGIAIAKHLMNIGFQDIVFSGRNGIICEGDTRLNPAQAEIAKITNRDKKTGSLADAMRGADVFIGVSVPNAVTPDMVKSMAKNAIVFPLANPVPEIAPMDAKEAGALIVGTGRSDFPNQINNVLVFQAFSECS